MRILLLLSSAFLISCSSPQSETTRSLSGADSLVINFNQPGTDSIERAMSTTEKKAIREISDLFSGQKKPATKCSLDGDLQFFQQGTLIGNIVFSYSVDSCREFILVEKDGSFNALPMSKKAADLFSAIREGRSWY